MAITGLARLVAAKKAAMTPRGTIATRTQAQGPAPQATQAPPSYTQATSVPDTSGRLADIEKQYASLRQGLTARQDAATRQNELLVRRAAAAGGGFGGAGVKLAQQGAADIAQQFAAQQSDIGAQEAAAKQALGSETAQMKFAAEEAAKGRAQAEADFQRNYGLSMKQLDFQTKAFWAEFDENLKTNFINTAVALKNAGLQTADNWRLLLDKTQGILPQLFGGRGPVTTSIRPVESGASFGHVYRGGTGPGYSEGT